MINGNIVQQVISYRKAQFEEKMESPRAFMSSTFHRNLQATQTEEINESLQVENVSSQTNEVKETELLQVSQQEFDRRFQEVSHVTTSSESIGSDKWGLTEKYNIQPVRSANEGKYVDIIERMSEKHGVPKALIQKMIEVESNFNPKVVSHAGAMGLMQLMPANVKEQGVKDPFSPADNIEGGVKEIAGYLKKYNGDLVLSLAAYNAGPGNVKKYGGVPPFKETENYIKKILNIDVTK
ncbi:lytic transglycosylase domain-containing protein [Bacillus manliponensis]|uniref:lytic transglycosylase domain-containing protein n=1 Tax=Bacillus manliponensis TaxID=574376 RepID=UPI0035176C10